MTKRDYYEVLGVSRSADGDTIKKAYRKAALKYHPDRNPDDPDAESLFKEATEAYQVLSDDANRAKYDQFGHAAFDGAGMGSGFGDFSGFEDLFGDIFGAFFGTGPGGGGSRVRSGRDLRYNLEITLEESAYGGEKEITLDKPVPCETCEGSGARKGTSPKQCPQCNGAGQIRVQQGFFAISRSCNVCAGSGSIIPDPCADCSGSGVVQKESTISVKIPAGIDEGQRLKLRGEGEPGPNGGPAGDLYVVISIAQHPVFRRQDTELICEVPISYSQAVLGGEIEVPTLEGSIKMKLPAGTPSGKVFRLRGKGIADVHSGRRGDQHVRTYIFVPTQVNERHRELLDEIAEVEGSPLDQDTRSFMDKVRDFF